jgi:hypothetical protein
MRLPGMTLAAAAAAANYQLEKNAACLASALPQWLMLNYLYCC